MEPVQEGARRTRRSSRRTSTRSCSSAARRASRSCKETVKKFFGKEPHQGVNPDEVVAIGAAVQAGVLSGDVKDMVLLDVTPLSLGVETLGGVMTVMIPRNTTIPTQKKEIFSTATDSQPSVEVHVLQGERTEARYNRTLGKLPPRGHHAGAARRAEGRGHVRHRRERHPLGPREGHGDRQGSEDHHHRELAASTRSEIQKMVKEAAEHEAEDKERREQIERRNKLDNLCYTLEKTIAENKEKLPAGDVATLEGLIKEGRAAVEKQDDDADQGSLEKLEKEAHRIASVMYQNAPGGRAAGGAWRRPPTAAASPRRPTKRREEGRRDRRRVRRDLVVPSPLVGGHEGRASRGAPFVFLWRYRGAPGKSWRRGRRPTAVRRCLALDPPHRSRDPLPRTDDALDGGSPTPPETRTRRARVGEGARRRRSRNCRCTKQNTSRATSSRSRVWMPRRRRVVQTYENSRLKIDEKSGRPGTRVGGG